MTEIDGIQFNFFDADDHATIVQALTDRLGFLRFLAERAAEGSADPTRRLAQLWEAYRATVRVLAKLQGRDPDRAVRLARRGWSGFAAEHFARRAASSPHPEGHA